MECGSWLLLHIIIGLPFNTMLLVPLLLRRPPAAVHYRLRSPQHLRRVINIARHASPLTRAAARLVEADGAGRDGGGGFSKQQYWRRNSDDSNKKWLTAKIAAWVGWSPQHVRYCPLVLQVKAAEHSRVHCRQQVTRRRGIAHAYSTSILHILVPPPPAKASLQ
jgi:hypothetical protein